MKLFMPTIAGLLFAGGAVLSSGATAEETTPQRIVSAGGDLTEIVYALGAQDRLVGVDSTSVYPAEATGKAQVGYVRRISPEGVLSLEPDLVLGAYDMGPPAALDQLRAAGVAVALAPDQETVDGVPAKIRFVGQAIGLSKQADALAAEVRSAMVAEIEKAQAWKGERPKVLFVLTMGESGLTVGGAGSSAESIIEMAGGINAAKSIEGYKPMTREAVLAAQPDVVLMMQRGADQHGGTDKVLERPEFALTPAGKNKRAIIMDGMLLLGFGPRTPQAIAELGEALRKNGQ